MSFVRHTLLTYYFHLFFPPHFISIDNVHTTLARVTAQRNDHNVWQRRKRRFSNRTLCLGAQLRGTNRGRPPTDGQNKQRNNGATKAVSSGTKSSSSHIDCRLVRAHSSDEERTAHDSSELRSSLKNIKVLA